MFSMVHSEGPLFVGQIAWAGNDLSVEKCNNFRNLG